MPIRCSSAVKYSLCDNYGPAPRTPASRGVIDCDRPHPPGVGIIGQGRGAAGRRRRIVELGAREVTVVIHLDLVSVSIRHTVPHEGRATRGVRGSVRGGDQCRRIRRDDIDRDRPRQTPGAWRIIHVRRPHPPGIDPVRQCRRAVR